MNGYMCDDCGEFFSDIQGGWSLDLMGLVVSYPGKMDPPYHFCSLECVRDWAKTHAG